MVLVSDQDALKHLWCDLVYLTDIMADFDCDVFFPEFDRGIFKVQERYVFILSSDHYRAGRPGLEPADVNCIERLQKSDFYM